MNTLWNLARTKLFHRNPPPYKVLFFGSDEFSVGTLKALVAADPSLISQIDVVCPADRVTKQRSKKKQTTPQVIAPKLKTFAEEHSLPIHQLHTDTNFRMKGWKGPDLDNYDLGIVSSFGYFIPRRIIKGFEHGMINVHPSQLPRYKGAAPIQHTLLNGDATTAASIIEVNPDALDTGTVLEQRIISVSEDDTYPVLHDKLNALGSEALLDVLKNYQHIMHDKKNNESITNSTGETGTDGEMKAPKITADMAIIDWQSSTSTDIHRKWRAFLECEPIFTFLNKKRIILREFENPICTLGAATVDADSSSATISSPPILSSTSSPTSPVHSDGHSKERGEASIKTDLEDVGGSIYFDQASKKVYVQCGDGKWLSITSFQVEGRKPTNARQFAHQFLYDRKTKVYSTHKRFDNVKQ